MTDKTNALGEVLDLVDENDNIIGEVTREEANSKPGLIHREAAVFVYDDQNRVLVQQRSFKKKVSPGRWEVSCAGHVPRGLSYEEVAHQELKEELGFDLELSFFKKELNHRPNETRFLAWFIGKYSGEEIVINKDEVEQVKFIDKDEFSEMTSRGEFGESSQKAIEQFWEEKMAAN